MSQRINRDATIPQVEYGVKKKMSPLAPTPKPHDLAFAARLREALRWQYGSVRRAALQAHIPYKTLHRYTTGERMPSGEEMQKLAGLLGEAFFTVLTGWALDPVAGSDLALIAGRLDESRRALLLRCATLLAAEREDIPSHLARLFRYIEADLRTSTAPRRVLRVAAADETRFPPLPSGPPCCD